MKTPYVMLAKIYTNYYGHMTKMSATPIYGKNPLKILLSRTRRLMTLGFGVLGLPNNDTRLTLTYLTSRSNLLPNAFEWEIFLKVEFFNTVEAKVIILT